jgi:hypothetical protein
VLLANADQWDWQDLVGFAETYWNIRVRERIQRGDFGRAWDELRKAYQGFNPKPLEPFQSIQRGELSNLTANNLCIGLLIDELYVAMLDKGLVSECSSEPVSLRALIGSEFKEDPSYWDKRRRLFPGEAFARLWMRHGQVSPSGQRAYHVAKYLSNKRNEKRKRKIEQAMSK